MFVGGVSQEFSHICGLHLKLPCNSGTDPFKFFLFIYFCSCLHLFNYISNLCKGLFWSLMDLMKPHPCLNILKLIICLAFETHNFNVSAFLATAETPRISACQCMPNALFCFVCSARLD